MKITLVSGSSRANSQSLKVAHWLKEHLHNLGASTHIIDLHIHDLPLKHEEIYQDIDELPAALELRKQFDESDGFVIITPEWDGMASPALKNIFNYAKRSMADKPALLVAVSGYRGGSTPIAELRMSSYKNTHIAYLPQHLIVRGAPELMNSHDPAEGSTDDQYIKGRAIHDLRVLIEYAKALRQVRASGVIDYSTYPNGM